MAAKRIIPPDEPSRDMAKATAESQQKNGNLNINLQVFTLKYANSPLQRRERTGKEDGYFLIFFEKLRYSNERSTKFENLKQE